MPALEARHPDLQPQIHSRIFSRDLPFSAMQVTWMGHESVFVDNRHGGCLWELSPVKDIWPLRLILD